jgi:uncharacterized protein YjbI with pentapeptide repeats
VRTWMIVALGLFLVFIALAYVLDWNWTGFPRKRLFDWLQIFVFPAAVAIGTFVLNQTAKRREETLADQRTQDTALQSYLDQMSKLLTDTKQAKLLRDPKEGYNLRVLARARTLTTLGQLDGIRKRSLLQFLHEADLINKKDRVVRLSGADLSKAVLTGIALTGADLGKTDLTGADLSKAVLTGANLPGADLSKAVLTGANLYRANLRGANLTAAAGVSVEALELQAESLVGTIMPDGSRHG